MVAAGYTMFIPAESGGGDTSAIRALRAMRALRPLRTITRFESLRAVVICFMEAVPLLSAVGGVLLAFLFLYAVAAVQMFTNVYHRQCMTEVPDPINPPDGTMVSDFGRRRTFCLRDPSNSAAPRRWLCTQLSIMGAACMQGSTLGARLP